MILSTAGAGSAKTISFLACISESKKQINY